MNSNIFENILLLPYEYEFYKHSINLVHYNSLFTKVKALHNKENKELRFFKEFDIKLNDKLVDEHNNVYFVEEILLNEPYTIKINNFLISNQKTINSLLIKYSSKQVEVPETIKQKIEIKTNINIVANNSNFNGGLANYNLTQNTNYNDIFNFLKLLVNNTYYIKELQPFLKDIEKRKNSSKPIKEKRYIKFFKYMGSQLLDITKQFIAAYATTLALS